jgi:hypothetical protein
MEFWYNELIPYIYIHHKKIIYSADKDSQYISDKLIIEIFNYQINETKI